MFFRMVIVFALALAAAVSSLLRELSDEAPGAAEPLSGPAPELVLPLPAAIPPQSATRTARR